MFIFIEKHNYIVVILSTSIFHFLYCSLTITIKKPVNCCFSVISGFIHGKLYFSIFQSTDICSMSILYSEIFEYSKVAKM